MTVNLEQELRESELKIQDLNKKYKQIKDENQRLKNLILRFSQQIKQMKKDYPFFDDGDSENYTLEDGKPLKDKLEGKDE